MALIHINNRSDFQILLKMEEDKTFPDFDFTLAFQTTGGFRYNVMSKDSRRFVPNAGRTQAVITFDFDDGNYFPNGRLAYTIKAEMQNAMFSDGYENTQTPRLLDIMIWDGVSDYSDAVEVDFILPYVSIKAQSTSSASPVFDTSNILRKRVPFGAVAYQLYYTNFIRVPNALAEQKQFDDKVPQWFSEFLKRLAKTAELHSIPVFVSQVVGINTDTPSCPNFCIGEILVHYDEEENAYYDTTITPIKDPIVPKHYYYDTMFFQVPYGVYYFDANRALHRYCTARDYRPVERELPINYQTCGLEYREINDDGHVGTFYVVNGYYYDHECYVRRRKHYSDVNHPAKRWYFYWRKTRRLRTLNNAPATGISIERTQYAFVRVRRRSIIYGDLCKTNRWVSRWLYFNVVIIKGIMRIRPAKER